MPASVRPTNWHHAAVVAQLQSYLASYTPRCFPVPGHRPAAVAVLLSDRAGIPHVTFTERAAHLVAHSGQISFPGGKVDDSDASFAAAAAREANEELGIPLTAIRALGELDEVPTPTGFVIRPVVAELTGVTDYQPNPGEVAEVFEAPLAHFADPAVREELGEREYRGVHYRLHGYRYRDHNIWGATARILEQLVGLL